jgi:hypothetical protein
MISKELQHLYDELHDIRRNVPPVSFELLQSVRDLDWRNIKNEEIDICCGIIVFTTPSIVMSSFDSHGRERMKYLQLFQDILSNISKSGIQKKSSDFQYFLDSFVTTLNDFKP